MNAAIKEDKLTEVEITERISKITTCLDDEEREQLNTIGLFTHVSKSENMTLTEKNSRKDEIVLLDKKINPFSLNSYSLKIEKMVKICI